MRSACEIWELVDGGHFESKSRYYTFDGGDAHHDDHDGVGGGEQLIQHCLGLQNDCRGEDDGEPDLCGGGGGGHRLQLHVQGDQTVCRAELVQYCHVGNDTCLDLHKQSYIISHWSKLQLLSSRKQAFFTSSSLDFKNFL